MAKCTDKDFQPDDPLDTGAWKLEENSLKPVWMRETKGLCSRCPGSIMWLFNQV